MSIKSSGGNIACVDLIPLLARWHFEQWGDLTGASTESDYKALLFRNAFTRNLPLTLIAVNHDRLLGSVNIVSCDMDIRSELKPWLAQLYVDLPERGQGIGTALVHGAVERSRKLGFGCLYLYTSGTLPAFYERIGWTRRENVYYKDKDRSDGDETRVMLRIARSMPIATQPVSSSSFLTIKR